MPPKRDSIYHNYTDAKGRENFPPLRLIRLAAAITAAIAAAVIVPTTTAE
jgi:hypothetical protein